MDILSELESAAKWSKINSYIYLFGFIFSILFILASLLLFTVGNSNINDIDDKQATTFMAVLFLLGGVVGSVISWIVRKVFIQYEQAARNAMQSMSVTDIEEVCHYQRNIFIVYGSYYILALVMIPVVVILAFLFAGAILRASGAAGA